jgi:hypothetical protein
MTASGAAPVRYDDLRAHLSDRGSVEDLVAFLAPLRESERTRLATGLVADIDRNQVERAALEHQATFLALLGCATNARQVTTNAWRLRVDGADVDLAARVLTDRSPSWLGSFAQAAMDSDTAPAFWALSRALVRAGACERPSGSAYLETMLTAAPDVRGGALGLLRDDPDLVEHELWEVLSEERSGRRLAWADSSTSHLERTWRHALVVLQRPDGSARVDRARLLDAVLDAFCSDRAAVDVRWFVGMHDALGVAADEVAERQGRYLHGLTSDVGAVARLSQRELDRIVGADLDVAALLALSPVPLAHPTKGVVQAHRTLLSKVARQHPVATERVRQLLEGDAVEPEPVACAVIVPDPVVRASAATVPRLENVEELVQLTARVLEEPCEIVDLERVLDGIARMPEAVPVGGSALVARARAILDASWAGPWQGCDPGADVAALVLAWLQGTHPPARPRYRSWIAVPYPWRPGPTFVLPRVRPGDSLGAWWSLRVREIASHAASGATGRPLLALPVTEDGAVTARSVVDRSGKILADAPWLPFDTALAALRLGDATGLTVPAGHRAAAALVRDVSRLGAYAPAWEAAQGEVPADDRGGDAPRTAFVAWRDAGGSTARRRRTDVLGALLVGCEPAQRYPADVETLCTHPWPSMFPHHPDLLGAHGHAPLLRAVRTTRSPVPVLAGLGRSPSTTPVVASALVLGMSAKDPVARVVAVDAAADLAATGALDGVVLGRETARLVAAGVVVAGRVARALREVGRCHLRAADGVVDAVVTALPALGRRPDTHLFVAALADAVLVTGRAVTLPEDLAALAAGRSRTALAQECRRVPREGTHAECAVR